MAGEEELLEGDIWHTILCPFCCATMTMPRRVREGYIPSGRMPCCGGSANAVDIWKAAEDKGYVDFVHEFAKGRSSPLTEEEHYTFIKSVQKKFHNL